MLPARRELLVLAGVGIAAAAAGALIGPLAVQSSSGAAELLGATFRDLNGRPRRLVDWRGQVLVCNFWATWCAPCLAEMPLLDGLRQKERLKGVEIVGIGIDHAAKIREFAAKLDISYPLLVADADTIELTRRLGNRAGGLPYTVVLDRRGSLAFQKVGPVVEGELEQVLAGLVR
jgi:thiol-disulfide isomerase/thioredoxin